MSDVSGCHHRIGNYDTEHHRRIHDETEEKPIEIHGASFRSTVLAFTLIPQSLISISRTLYFPHNRLRIDDLPPLNQASEPNSTAGLVFEFWVNVYTVQKLDRWKTITMVLRYAHHQPESLRAGAEVLDRL